ncbi:hypothetical protein NDU88_011024 [Pleurodeles waltl]|uniref:Uncharacterized protein n=1 Tax=Pleurodeles waltl TaxID=8319 RepID=A0AAV7QYX5_PLEWA|nr:hypothetical protein NDU88_011024 [Pleurodeles waltl]
MAKRGGGGWSQTAGFACRSQDTLGPQLLTRLPLVLCAPRVSSSCRVPAIGPSIQDEMAPGLQPRRALSAPTSRSAPSARRRDEWCAGEGQDRQWAQEKDRLRGAPFVPEPRGLPRRRRAPMQLEVAATRPLSGRLTATLIPSELLLRDTLVRRLPLRVTPDQLCAPEGMFTPPQRTHPRPRLPQRES